MATALSPAPAPSRRCIFPLFGQLQFRRLQLLDRYKSACSFLLRSDSVKPPQSAPWPVRPGWPQGRSTAAQRLWRRLKWRATRGAANSAPHAKRSTGPNVFGGDRANEVEPGDGRFEVGRENWRALNRIDLREQRIVEERQTGQFRPVARAADHVIGPKLSLLATIAGERQEHATVVWALLAPPEVHSESATLPITRSRIKYPGAGPR